MENEGFIRLAVFLGLFLVFAFAERSFPRRILKAPQRGRWITNITIAVLNTALLRLMQFALPLLAIGAAINAKTHHIGLFNQLDWPLGIEIMLTILILDFAIWAQHLLTHKVPLLWRVHRIHHADTELDVTTAIRFHPIEIGLSMLVKIGLIYLIGPAALAVLLFEILLNGAAMFNHANLKLPDRLDRVLRLFLVTPDMHRVHHSVHRHEHDSNYGFSLSLWDRLFGTYIAHPQTSHETMTLGLEWQNEKPARLGWSLSLPFRRK